MDHWFYLSFVDPDRPAGERWLGGCYVEGLSPQDALSMAHVLGINPGGDALIAGPFTADQIDENVPLTHRNRLLNLAELGPTVALSARRADRV